MFELTPFKRRDFSFNIGRNEPISVCSRKHRSV